MVNWFLPVGRPMPRRTCGVVSAAWRTAAIARSGASSGPRSSQARARRSKSRSLVMPSVLRGRPAPRRPRRPRAGHESRSGVANGRSRPGCRGCRRSRSAAARCGDAGRRQRAARRTGVGTPGRAHRGRRCRGAHPELLVRRPAGPGRSPPTAPTPGLGVARVDEQAPDPGFEAIRVTQGRELAPDGDEGALQGVLGEIVVAQDPRGERIHPVAGHAGPMPRTHRDRRSVPGRRDLAPSLPLSRYRVVPHIL